MPAILVPCYDTYLSTVTVAQGLMETHGLVSSFFVDFNTLDANYTHPTTDQVVNFQSSGHEIGIYSGVYPDGSPNGCNFLQLSQKPNGLRLAHDWLLAIKATAASKGFNPASLAPYQRAWLPAAKELARHSVTGVRVIDLSCWQTYPIPDPLYFRCGDTVSLGGSNTFASLKASVDSIPAGSIGIYILHMIGPVGDPYTLPTPVFDAWTTYLQSLVNSGTHRVVTFNDALKAP